MKWFETVTSKYDFDNQHFGLFCNFKNETLVINSILSLEGTKTIKLALKFPVRP